MAWWSNLVGILRWGGGAPKDAPTTTPSTPHTAGKEFEVDATATPAMPPLSSMSALAAFPLVHACANLVAAALASRPRRVMRGRGKNASPVEGHPFEALMLRPSLRVGGNVFYRQRVVDLLLTGNSYTRILVDAELGAQPSLFRLHPNRSEIVPRKTGDVDGVLYDHALFVPWEQLLLVRQPSWEDNPAGMYGVGWIQVLADELNTELAAMLGTQSMAQKGAPGWLLMPELDKDGRSQPWTEDQTKKVTRKWTDMLSSKNSGGVIATGHRMEAKPLGFSAVDMQFVEGRKLAAERICAVARVPPSKLGLRGSNYSTSRAEDVNFWEARIDEAALLDEEDSRLAAELGRAGDWVMTDFAGIDALQYNRTARQSRVVVWMQQVGLTPADALAAEGFDDIDAPVSPPPGQVPGAKPDVIKPSDPAPMKVEPGEARSWWDDLVLDPELELAKRARDDAWREACAGRPVRFLAAAGCRIHGHLDRQVLDAPPQDDVACACTFIPLEPEPAHAARVS